jgi:hypothetical protein
MGTASKNLESNFSFQFLSNRLSGNRAQKSKIPNFSLKFWLRKRFNLSGFLFVSSWMQNVKKSLIQVGPVSSDSFLFITKPSWWPSSASSLLGYMPSKSLALPHHLRQVTVTLATMFQLISHTLGMTRYFFFNLHLMILHEH